MNGSVNSKRPVAVCIFILVAAAFIAMGSDEPALTLAVGSVISLAVGLLWGVGTAALLMVVLLQLSQVVMPLIYANLVGVPLQNVSKNLGEMTSTTWFALAAILSLVIGMWCGQLGPRSRVDLELQLEAKTWSPQSAFVFCLVTVALAAVFEILGGLYAGLQQPALAASRVEWLGVFVLACVCSAQRRGYGYLMLVVCMEVIKGFSGYFGDFKEVFFVLLVGTISGRSKLSARTILPGLVAASVALALGVFWSAVKQDYRTYISQGAKEQVVLASAEDRFAFLIDRLLKFDGEEMRRGFYLLAVRWSYTDILAATMRNVPARVPFQDGALMGTAVMHVLQPRLLFPDKPGLASDTDMTVRYSGVRFDIGNNAANTSISLGWVGEFYVDYGFVGALVASFIFGLLLGRSVKVINSLVSLPAIVNGGLTLMLMMTVTSFEQNFLKMMGSFLMTLMIIFLFRWFLLPHLLQMFGPTNPARPGTIVLE